MKNECFLKEAMASLVKESIERLRNGEEGNFDPITFGFTLSREDWKVQDGFYKGLFFFVSSEDGGNFCVKTFHSGGKIFFKEKDEIVFSDEQIREIVGRWEEQYENNYLSLYADEVVANPYAWLFIGPQYINGEREDILIGDYQDKEARELAFEKQERWREVKGSNKKG